MLSRNWGQPLSRNDDAKRLSSSELSQSQSEWSPMCSTPSWAPACPSFVMGMTSALTLATFLIRCVISQPRSVCSSFEPQQDIPASCGRHTRQWSRETLKKLRHVWSTRSNITVPLSTSGFYLSVEGAADGSVTFVADEMLENEAFVDLRVESRDHVFGKAELCVLDMVEGTGVGIFVSIPPLNCALFIPVGFRLHDTSTRGVV